MTILTSFSELFSNAVSAEDMPKLFAFGLAYADEGELVIANVENKAMACVHVFSSHAAETTSILTTMIVVDNENDRVVVDHEGSLLVRKLIDKLLDTPQYKLLTFFRSTLPNREAFNSTDSPSVHITRFEDAPPFLRGLYIDAFEKLHGRGQHDASPALIARVATKRAADTAARDAPLH